MFGAPFDKKMYKKGELRLHGIKIGLTLMRFSFFKNVRWSTAISKFLRLETV